MQPYGDCVTQIISLQVGFLVDHLQPGVIFIDAFPESRRQLRLQYLIEQLTQQQRLGQTMQSLPAQPWMS